jgi:hypothetical protein
MFLGTSDQRAPNIDQFDGYADIAHNRIFVGVRVSNWGPNQYTSWPINLTIVHEMLHFAWHGAIGDSHENWAAILGAEPNLDEWLKNDCSPKVKK